MNIYDDKLFELYTLAEMKYKKNFENVENLYPSEWYNNYNYKLKIKILSEAIKNNQLIINTKTYLENLEGVYEK